MLLPHFMCSFMCNVYTGNVCVGPLYPGFGLLFSDFKAAWLFKQRLKWIGDTVSRERGRALITDGLIEGKKEKN